MKKKTYLSMFLSAALSVNLLAIQTPAPAQTPAQPAAAAPNQDEPKGLTPKQKEKQRKALQKELDKPFEQWLKQDVVYIITDEEKASWKRLNTAEEREQFIEQFWLRRDPTPDTPENEYKEEHYRRIAYSNEHFASGIPGWKTDRGKIYIMNGPPDEIESHPSGGSYQRPQEEGGGTTSTYPFEKWRYRYIEGVGQEIIIEFVDTTMSGEYHMTMDPSEKDALLYVPNAGLTDLESMGMASKTDRFNRTDGTHLGTSMGGTPASMGEFERLEQFAKLQKPPAVKFKDLETVVESKVTYNLMPFQTRTDFIKITNDTVLAAVTVQLSNKDLTFQNKEGLQHAAVNIFGRVSTMTRRVAQTFEDVVTVDVPAELLPSTLERKNVYWQALPLRPGRYRLNLVVKDIQSGNMGTLEKAIIIPSFDDETLATSSLILSDKIEKVATKDIGKGQFVIGSTKVRPSVNETFKKSDHMGIYMQVYNMEPDEKTHRPSATIQYNLTKFGAPADSKALFEATEKTEDMPGGSAQQLTLEKILPLESLAPGKYTLRVKVTDNIANKTISPSASFTVQ
jgi:GWxTD domain-containing protein